VLARLKLITRGAILIILFLTAAIAQPQKSLALDSNEIAWIASHPIIRIGIDPQRVPIEFQSDDGSHSGISSDYIRRISAMTGLRFQHIKDLSWSEVLKGLQQGKIDMISAARPTAARKEYLEFTTPYLRIPMVIVTHEKTGYVDGLGDLSGKKVGNVRGYASSEYLGKGNPDVQMVSFDNYAEALRHLAQNEIFAVVGNLAAMTYEMQTRKYPLRIAAPLNMDSELAMGVRKDWPELVSIINKALVQIPESERSAIKNQWIYANVVIGTPWHSILQGIGIGLLIFVIVFTLFAWWNRRLHNEVQERITAERKARESEHKYHMLFEHVQQAFALHEIITDAQGQPIDYRYLEANPAFKQLTGIEPSIVIGKTVRELMPRTEQYWIDVYGKVALTGTPMHFEQYAQNLGRWNSTWAFSPSPNRFAVLFSDITVQRQQQDKMREQNESMTHFIYTVSHDLKSPLLTLANFTHELHSDIKNRDEEAVNTDLGYIDSAITRMTKLVEELQMVAQAGSKKLSPSHFTLQEIAQEVYQSIASRYINRKIQFIIKNGNHTLYGDRDRIGQLFQNLLDNAAKYMGDTSEPCVEIGTSQFEGETAYYIQDNGLGIPKDKIGKVFGIFEKVNKDSDGSGIGLALAQRIVEAHHGRIWAVSAGEKKGTTFYFTLRTTPGATA